VPRSDNYRYEGGRVCGNQAVRADYLDQVVWDHITGLLADPALIRAEIDKRLEQARTCEPLAEVSRHGQLADWTSGSHLWVPKPMPVGAGNPVTGGPTGTQAAYSARRLRPVLRDQRRTSSGQVIA